MPQVGTDPTFSVRGRPALSAIARQEARIGGEVGLTLPLRRRRQGPSS